MFEGAMILQLRVNKQTISRTDPYKPSELSQGYLYIRATFDNTWRGLSKKLIAKYGNQPLSETSFNEDNIAEVPIDVIQYPGFTVSIVGVSSEGTTVVTTPSKEIPVTKNDGISGGTNYVRNIVSDTVNVNIIDGVAKIELKDPYIKSITYNAETEGLDIYNANNEYSFVHLGLEKVFMQNVQVSEWQVDDTYADYGYRAAILNSKITENSVISVIFGLTEATSGDYAPICDSHDGVVYIYSKVNNAIVIPTIKEL